MKDSNKIKTFSKSTNIALGVEAVLLLIVETALLVFIAWYDRNYEAAWDGLAIYVHLKPLQLPRQLKKKTNKMEAALNGFHFLFKGI